MEYDGKPTYMKPYSYMEEALCKAAADGNLAAASRIMHERIDPNCKDAVGRSPMHYAALNGHFEIIRLLLCNRALVDVSDANNVTPLHMAARNDHLRCAQLLCMAGADISRTCASGCTPRDLAPFDSQTCYFLERCELGEKPKPKSVFSRPSKWNIPVHAIPQKPRSSAKSTKGKGKTESIKIGRNL
ncbi:cortactin-binding protein 2 [Clonorchis sinensis]|uniref:Cortactin-binding protein 2 n=1 Tax=Clonorchis sinensis TaxID=79923 RepID=H2KNK9_CLOSI|nr:cortactin-binding protein 2 [Clonorchis sinensis]